MAERDVLGSDGLIVRDSGSWVDDKLYYLGRYLKIFSVGMKNKWAGRLYYVDLLAGPGGMSHTRYTKGNRWLSPRRSSRLRFREILLLRSGQCLL